MPEPVNKNTQIQHAVTPDFADPLEPHTPSYPATPISYSGSSTASNMATDDLPAQALDPDARFNWVFLVELLVCGLVALFFLFYFNRVFSKALSLLIRLWLRWKGLPNYVDIQSLQISLLAGRIFFGRVTYHGVNETITIVSGHITWRYWLRRVRHASVGTADDGRDGGIEGAGGDTRSEDLPCRILAELKGVEWFIYNRSPAYDYIIEQMAPNQQNEDAASEGRKETGYSGHSGADDSKAETISARMKSSIGSLMRDHEGPTGESSNATTNAESDSAYLSMLPVKILVNRGAVVMGNNNTPSVLVAHFEKADASIDATRSVASVDKYKQVFSVDFTHPVVQFKTNMEYKEPLVSRGARLLSSDAETNLHQKSHQLRNRRQKLKDLLPIFSESIESLTPSDVTNNDFPLQSRVTGQDRWVGLRMYLDEGQDEGWKFEPAEYAKVSTVLDCPKGKMNFFWDIPGTVDRPRSSSTQTSGVTDPPDEDINGSEHTPPEWGIDLSFEGGTIQYGPWTDRQRVHLQNMFAPRIYKTATPRNKLQEGESRIATKFKLFVELSSSTILRIPVREESKDWKFRRRLNDGEVRPFGWLEIKVAAESTISYEMSMVPSPTGWKNGLKLDLKSPEVRSSVNHGLLWKATQQAIDADLSGPLQWNGKHKWTFDVLCRGIEIFILREHVTLITDLVTDWATGPPSEYWSFTPFLYDIILRFEDRFEVCMNVNDQNIINNPSDIEDNTLLILHGDGGLKAKVGLDMTRFRPDESTVSFDIWIDGEETNLQLGAKQPVWNTWHSFLSPEIGMKLATVKEIMVKGSYNYYATTGPGLIDTLLLDISGSGLKLKLFGFLIRYFLVIRENYFGENLHFKTLEEWQNQGGRSGATMIEGNNKKANDLDVMLTVEAKNSCVIMPKHLYGGTGKNLKLNFASLGIDMRFTNYYMDLQVNVSPITAYISSTPDNPQIFIDGLTIYGHRLFGLPPTEPTYVCNWDLDIGTIIGECTPDFLPTAICALKGFIFGFEDKENALPVSESADLVVHDVTFIRVSLKSLKLWLRTDSPSAIRVTSGEILFILNDLADEKHSERISLSIPDLTMSCVDVNYGSGDLVQNTETSGHLGTSLKVTVFGRKKNFSKDRALQMKHVRESDYRTGRAKFLIREDFEEDGSRASSMYNENLDIEPPSLPLPSLPKPLYGGDSYHGFLGSSKGSVTSGHTGSTGIRRKSSFLAASSISSAVPSILRATSSHAPSFHSAVETLSSEIPIAAALRENLRVPLSPAPTTPGSQSPRRSMRARSRQESSDGQSFAATKSRSKVLLSSSFAKPLFPLGSVEPDLKNVPWLASGTESGYSEAAENSFTLESAFIDESTSQTSIIIDFVSGIRGYCTAVGVKAVLQLVECIQPKSPEDILDSIQISVVDRLVKLMTNKSQDSAITEVYLKIPQFKFCFTNPVPKTLAHNYYSIDGERADEDAYNLELSNLLVSARSKTVFPLQRNNQEELGGKEVFSCHILLGTLEVIMSQRQAGYQDSLLKPALCLLVQGLLFWASTNETSTASLKIETIASSLQSNQAMFLYDAAIRTEALIADLQRTFKVLSNNEKQRVQALAYSLAVAGEEFGITGDPSSLTRPSYVLRSALDHVRVNDSWKVMSRMRHIYQSVPVAPRENLQIRCISNLNQCPVDGRRWVVSAFERWRSWELADLHSSYIVDAIFGPEDSNEGPIRSAGPMEAQIGITGVKMLVDPGPMQCEFVLGHITAKSSFGNPDILNSSMVSTVAGPNLSVSTIVQAHCRSIQLGLTWEILEIFDGLSKAFAKRHSGSETSKAASVASIGSSKKQSFHVLLTTDTGSLILDTINLKSISRAHNFHVSLFISRKNSDIQEALLGSILLRSDLATSELKCGNRTLSMTKLKNPSIYGHFDEHCLADTRFNIWKVAGSCEDLSFDIREEILGLMEVIDFVVNDEVSRIWRLVEDLKRSSLSRPPPQPTAPNSPTFPFFPRRNVHVLHLTLSLENFTIEATLLPSLAYVMRGNGVRGSTRPKHATEEIILDFDVLYHEHEIRTGYDKAQTRSISVLQMPSINGRVRHQDSAEEQLIEVFISVETIKLDASSIQSLLNALTKPEVGNVIESARVEWMGTQARLDEIFDTPDKPPVPSVKTGTPLVYRAHVGVSGLTIQSSAPSATLNIDLGCIRVHASNKPNADILLLPEVHVEFREITVELTKVTTDGSLETCGYIELHASILCSSTESARGKIVRAFYVTSHSLQIDLFAETASTIVDVAGHLQDKLRDLDLSREVKYLRKLRSSKPLVPVESAGPEKGRNSMQLFTSVISVEMKGIQISWITGASTQLISLSHTRQNLVLSFKRINFATATKKANEARLTIEEFLVQMVDQDSKVTSRSENSAVMPEVIFNVAYFLNDADRRLAFQAKGTSLDLRLTSSCVVGINQLETSIATASEKFRDASATWKSTPTESGAERENMFGTKRLRSVLVDADFAGAVVHISKASESTELEKLAFRASSSQGRYGQFAHGDSNGITILKSPGLAFKAEYVAPIDEDPSLNAEIKISASNNILYPSVVPLILEMSSNIKEVMREPTETKPEETQDISPTESKEPSPGPAAILGKCRLNIGLRICKQEFTLSCQPIARVAASAGYDEIYVTLSTCEEAVGGRFYALSVIASGFEASLKHVYSRDSTGQLQVREVVASLMNSKHLNGSDGLSCTMKMSPIKSQLNIKQFQDFLLFREIWLPEEIRKSSPAPVIRSPEPSPMLAQRYHKVAATKAFPWNTAVSISEIDLQLDLGQSLGKNSLLISNLWMDSRKSSDWEQTMSLGFDAIKVTSVGRLSGFIHLKNMKVRTSIHWLSGADEVVQTPLIQASLGFEQLQVKASFDYQAFLLADITSFHFLMYNLQKAGGKAGDQLVGVLDGDKIQIYCTTLSASQGLALYQAFLRLRQEKIDAFNISLKDVERYLNRRSQSNFTASDPAPIQLNRESLQPPAFLSLYTDVVVMLKEVSIGIFPSTFHDTQVFKLDALNASAQFGVGMEVEKLHSKLEMTLGELRIALATIKRPEIGSSLGDVSVEDIVYHARSARGGTILKVPQVTAFMHTWHKAGSNEIEYIFKSAFKGKVDVGWNYSRVSFIKEMWANHVKEMSQRQGKIITNSHISISTNSPPPSEAAEDNDSSEAGEQRKITAVVNVPQSKYEYTALEPPIIETPQLRDMGEATPPLEWIGLHRDRLPNLTHQIVIVSLLEIAREVEDAYSKILGTS